MATLALMLVASPNGTPELAQRGENMLFSFPWHQHSCLSAVIEWCNIAPLWLVIEQDEMTISCVMYVIISAADFLRRPDKPYLKVKVVSWSFLQATCPTFHLPGHVVIVPTQP